MLSYNQPREKRFLILANLSIKMDIVQSTQILVILCMLVYCLSLQFLLKNLEERKLTEGLTLSLSLTGFFPAALSKQKNI